MREIQYSIIIPHHNIPQLLERCLSSIPVREDVQIIVVDDKSEDSCLLEVKNLKRKFEYVDFYFLEENRGGGGARNYGLNKAKGQYVLFADADDFFNYSINKILDDYKQTVADVVFFDAISMDTDTYHITSRARHLNLMIHDYFKQNKKAELRLRYEFGEPWCKMIKRELIIKNKIKFDEFNIHNDTKFSYLVGFYGVSCVVDNRAIYCVTTRAGSVSKITSLDRLLTRTRVYAEANVFFKQNSIDYFEEKALRPMMFFLVHGKIKQYRQCRSIIISSGISRSELFWRQMAYPYYVLNKIVVNLSEIFLKLHNVGK